MVQWFDCLSVAMTTSQGNGLYFTDVFLIEYSELLQVSTGTFEFNPGTRYMAEG